MDTIKVNVVRNANGYHATAIRGKFHLCDFKRGIDPTLWVFNLPEGFNAPPTGLFITAECFPLDYFKRLCQSMLILSGFATDFPEIELTAQAKNLGFGR